MNITLPARLAAFVEWVTIRIVCPSRLISLKMSNSPSAALESSAPVGSSASTSCGWVISALATAGLPLLGVVPEDAAVTISAASGVPLVLTTYKGAAPAYLNISKRLLGQRVPLLRIR